MATKKMVAGVDAVTGEITERELTAEEIAEFEALGAEVAVTFEVAPKATDEAPTADA